MSSLFWKDLATDLEDPEFLREYVRESIRIATVDAIMNALDQARLAEGLSKADLARAIGAEPAVVRRLFAAGNTNPNPTLGTLVDVAAALGLRIKVEPLPDEEREAVTDPLRNGTAGRAAIEKLIALRSLPEATQPPDASAEPHRRRCCQYEQEKEDAPGSRRRQGDHNGGRVRRLPSSHDS